MKVPIILLASIGSLIPTLALGKQCRCLPRDDCWPSERAWERLNCTVMGRLVATVPVGSPCHDPSYDETACGILKDKWNHPLTHLESSSSVMQSFFANQSCSPFTPPETPCTLGNYVNYAVEVESAKDVQATIKFANKNNIRLVVRNTGHDYFGRSTGAGSLAIWTHRLKTANSDTWSDEEYEGPCMKLGAGVLGYEAIDAANEANLVVVSGLCPTVGVAGGFTQGGGHSMLSGEFGLAADQTLAFEVVTANGQHLFATKDKNSDLYWALSGGSPGTFGVVVSITVRAYPDIKVAGASISFLAPPDNPSAHVDAIEFFHDQLPDMTDQGATASYFFNSALFSLLPLTLYGGSKGQVEEMLQPFIAKLDELGIAYSTDIHEFKTYREHFQQHLGPLPYGRFDVEAYQFGSRLIPRSVLADKDGKKLALYEAFAGFRDAGLLAIGAALNVSAQKDRNNAVHPGWRDAIVHMQLSTMWDPADWDGMIEDQRRMSEEFVPALEAVTPGSATYVNEADFGQKEWKEAFFGPNYDALLEIKKKWDPMGLFYGLKLVGSDMWEVAEDGRMCRVE